MSLITIFNGRSRSLGKNKADIYLQVSVELRKHLHLFKKARLSVFICIALHSEEDGWTRNLPVRQISEETGLHRDTIEPAITELCNLMIEDERVLYREQDKQSGNRYLIFPTKEELEKLEAIPEKLPYPIQEKIGYPIPENFPQPTPEKLPYPIPENFQHPIKDRENKEDFKEDTHRAGAREEGVCVSEKEKELRQKLIWRSEHSEFVLEDYAKAFGLGPGWVNKEIEIGLNDTRIQAWLDEKRVADEKQNGNGELPSLVFMTFDVAATYVNSVGQHIRTDEALADYIGTLNVSDEDRERLKEKFLKKEAVS